MKVYASYENGYEEQQVAIKTTAQALLTEAITARLKDGKITADELALYGAILEEAETDIKYAKEQYAKEKEGKK